MKDSSTEATRENEGTRLVSSSSPSSFPPFASVQPSPYCALGIDVGGTKIAAGIVRFPSGKLNSRHVIPTASRRGGTAVLADVAQLASDLCAEARTHQMMVEAIGFGVCELVDLDGNIVSACSFDWRRLPVRQQLSQIAPTIIEADVRAAALAEALFGAGCPFRQFLYVTIGTGISSCLMLDGRPFTGAHGATGTMASSPLPSLSADSSMHSPTLEQVASGPALVTRFNAAGGSAHSAEEVLSAAATGDSRAIEVVRSAAHALGASIGLLVNVLDPAAVVIGGGLGLSQGLFRQTWEASARRHIWSELHRDLPVLTAALGTDAGIIGAAATAWQRLNRSLSQTSRGVERSQNS